MKTIKLIEQNGEMKIASHGDRYETTDEEYSKITDEKYITYYKDGKFSFEKADNYDEIVSFRLNAEISILEKQMKNLNSDRKDLQDLIDLGLDAPGDKEAITQITTQLGILATERKQLITNI